MNSKKGTPENGTSYYITENIEICPKYRTRHLYYRLYIRRL